MLRKKFSYLESVAPYNHIAQFPFWSIHKRTKFIKNLQISLFITFAECFILSTLTDDTVLKKAAKFHLLENTATNEIDSTESCLYFFPS